MTDPHPYAEAWPLLGAEEAAELAADIEANGLRDPIVTYQGMILDGRNRYAACITAEVEPHFVEFDGDDDAALAFVQSVNNARRHQSKGSLAASWALSMLAAGKRKPGRWDTYGESPEVGKSEQNARSLTGIIADYAPELLVQVRDDSLSLNAAHQQAEHARDAERERQEREAQAAQNEIDAERIVREQSPEIAAQVEASGWTWTAGLEEVRRRDREFAEQERREKAEAERKERERRDSIRRQAAYITAWIANHEAARTLRDNPLRAEILAELDPTNRKKFLQMEKDTWPIS